MRESLEKILRLHAERYPLMRPADAVKLLYQREFGCGHLISDPQKALLYLEAEARSVEDRTAAVTVKPLGGGLIRVYLPGLSEAERNALGRAFLRSAVPRGNRRGFTGKLSLLRRLTREGVFGFSEAELAAYLNEYRAQGYPMVSHSPEYRRAYAPAYRVVIEKIYREEQNRDRT
ncbi:MAG: hypothetical protein KIG36_06745 [Eubacteriales bacterium]|nr:hypothetical protein [Eubacteriales bacterium]